MKRPIFLLFILVALILAACGQGVSNSSGGESGSTASNSEGSSFPEKGIKFIVPYPPGGSTDTIARLLGEVLPKYLPQEQKVIIENVSGGVGAIGVTKIINSKPDGYTIGLSPISPFAVQPHFGEVNYSYDSVQPILEVYSSEGMLVVPSDSPWNTFEEWLAYVKENPGKFQYATAGSGSLQHIQAEVLSDATGIDITHVPYDGLAEVTTAIIGGHVNGAIMQPSQAGEYIKTEQLRPLVYLGTGKSENFTDVPLLSEVGIDIAMDNFSIIFGPKDIPQEILDILTEAFQKAVKDPKVVEFIENSGDTVQSTSGEELVEKVENTYNTAGNALKASGLLD